MVGESLGTHGIEDNLSDYYAHTKIFVLS